MHITTRLVTTAALLALAGGCATPTPDRSNPGPMQKAERFQFTRTVAGKVNYLVFLPKGYEPGGQRWPLILFLHGAGERGTNVWKVATHGPPKIAPTRADFPFIVVSPQCPDGHIWSRDALLALLDDVEAKLAVDTNRVYLTGLSMGGYGTWDLGVACPDRFAAIVPICGGGQLIGVMLSSRANQAALQSLGVWAFHGGKDPVVPLEESQRMVEALKKAGVSDIKLTVYPEAGHDSWTEAYNNPELYTWLLKHQRGK